MIREHGPISRSEIAKRNGISPTTVASATQELMKEGYVCEVGAGASNGGRKPILLKLASDHLYLIGISVSNFMIEIAQMNLEANISRRSARPVRSLSGDELIEAILSDIALFLQQCPPREQCIGISLITPGVVNSESGTLYFNSKLHLENIPFKQLIETRFGIKTWVENDLNAMVLAEKRFGPYGKCKNMIYVSVADGVGAGIFFHDILLRGGVGGAGELGHTIVDRNGIRCECGNVGCLENYVNWPAVYSRIFASVTRGKPSVIMDLAEGDITRITPAIFKEAIQKHDPLAVDLADEISSFLGLGMVNLINLFNPEIVIIGGSVCVDNNRVIENVRKYVASHALPVLRNLPIRQSTLGKDADLIAAASILLQDIFHFSLAE
ncbi:transcriptional regulator [Paenibacillus beijingensis]|uniref:Transcriptional regulator n=2 Tax=Paenibacillus beijingensis TaxID=1126833 RepID=A0A0D5NRX9_9BACL|nr:transcriptional regulator [Paenibacillus beijingensis]